MATDKETLHNVYTMYTCIQLTCGHYSTWLYHPDSSPHQLLLYAYASVYTHTRVKKDSVYMITTGEYGYIDDVYVHRGRGREGGEINQYVNTYLHNLNKCGNKTMCKCT